MGPFPRRKYRQVWFFLNDEWLPRIAVQAGGVVEMQVCALISGMFVLLN